MLFAHIQEVQRQSWMLRRTLKNLGLLAWRLKLIAIIPLHIHMTANQGRIYVLCVTNGLHRRDTWSITVKGTLNTVHICSQCEKSFSSQCKLRRHMNIHASKYQCSVCGRCFDNSSNLAVHRRSHSGEKPFECTVCNKRFTASSHLVSHSRIHSGEKPYKCHVCDKAFSESGNLNTHMRVHTGEKPYKCSLCDKSFSRSSNLQMHKFFVTATEDRINVLGVGWCVRFTVNWSFMFIFALVQSRTLVDTV